MFPEISLPWVYAHTFSPSSDLSCSAFSSHVFTSCWLQALGTPLSSLVLGAFPRCQWLGWVSGHRGWVLPHGKGLGFSLSSDWESLEQTGRVSSVALSDLMFSEGEWDNCWEMPVQDLSLEWHFLKPNMVFWGK